MTRSVTTMTIHDVLHYTAEQRAAIIASYPIHERDARTLGVPMLGSGLVFPVAEEAITCDQFKLPDWYVHIGGMDFGIDHPFGATRLSWDRDDDVVYVTAEYRERHEIPAVHVASLKAWGAEMPWAWPHDGLQRDKGSGDKLADQYRGHGLNMLPERAEWPDGTIGFEAGLAEMLERMRTGRWKVFSTCVKWLEERRLYHRKDGLVVKERDDLISSSRYGLMMLRHAKEADKGRDRSVPLSMRAKQLGWVA